MNGKMDEVKGRMKEAAGAITDDDDLRQEGKVDQVIGKTKQAVQKTADKINEAIDDLKDAGGNE